jgi:hypothetical protein
MIAKGGQRSSDRIARKVAPAASLAAGLGAVALALAACAARDPPVEAKTGVVAGSKWQIERAIDRITNARVSSALVQTRTVANSFIAFPPPAAMQLTCFKGGPIVRFTFPFKVGSTRNAQLGYAFDQNPGREPDVRFVEGAKNVVIEDPDEVARFASGLAGAATLYVRIRSLNVGRTSAEFEVAGAPAAIAAAYEECPLPKAGDPKAKDPKAKDRKSKKPKVARASAGGEEAEDTPDSPAQYGLSGGDTAWQSEEEAALRQLLGWFGR